MKYGVLGALEIVVEGERIDAGPPQQRAVLASLLLHANRVVPVDRIIDDVWGERPPASAEHAVHMYVSRLRKVLAAHEGDVIVTERPGYRLQAQPEDIDAGLFEQLLEQAGLLMATNPRRAADLAGEALELWRGPAFADFASSDFADAEARRLEELRLVALEEQVEARLALGQHQELAASLEAFVSEHPFRERSRGQLMLALYRCGRQADALAAFQQLRSTLGEELGIEPSAEVAGLEERILLQDPELDLVAARISAGNLPLSISSFVGDEARLEEVAQLVSERRLVTLTGPAGVGKTRLAIETGHRVREGFPGGVWFVALVDCQDFEQVVASTAAALDMREEPGRGLVEQLADHIRGRPMLVVLDNCEQVIDAAADLAASLLRGSGGLHILATSRETLRAEGEVCVPVTPLGFPDPAKPWDAGRLTTYPAVDLFCQRAAAVDPRFRLDEERAAPVVRLCAELDGLPLALELAAATARTLAVEEIVDRIGSRFTLLSGGQRTTIAHHQTLEAAIAWSFELLDEEEQAIFVRLGVMAGFDLEAAEHVCAGTDLDDAAVAGTLGRLVGKSLVVVDDLGGGRRRYRMLETIRAFALARLRDSDDWDRTRLRHAEHYLGLAESFTQVAEFGEGAAA